MNSLCLYICLIYNAEDVYSNVSSLFNKKLPIGCHTIYILTDIYINSSPISIFMIIQACVFFLFTIKTIPQINMLSS